MKLLKLGVENNDLKKWQYFLIGQGHYQGLVTGKFDVLTQSATVEFQKAQNLQPDGIVGNRSIGCAKKRFASSNKISV